MPEFIGLDGDIARALLADVGVVVLREDSADIESLMGATLDDASRLERGSVVAVPPLPGCESEGFGAWHRNNANEFHIVIDGVGLVEFMTEGGPVAALLSAGDIMVVRQAEHRYLPLTPQGWVVRFGGGPDAELVPTDTGRPAGPWPRIGSTPTG